ncbi:hypothetical protein KJ980_07975 [Patescibacteria group bacterium]|nr:hypothetical protein [Patescibacteria group bacterium]MBU4017283.1 hypothetical protein [Patescibacteria group bacterium]MBU4099556.1 hypothetical protein [Patescibacteria group bacterium]
MENPVQPPVQQIPQNPIIPPVPQASPQTPQVPPTPPTPPTTVMPTPKKPLILILALIALIVFATIVYLMKSSSSPDIKNTSNIPAPTAKQNITPTVTIENNTLLPTGTSAAQLDQDIQNIDTELGTLESNLENVDQGLNDQSLDLTE